MATRKKLSRSHCPVNYGLEIFGDKWSLLIVRDIVFTGKKTYGEFLESDEGIATNILADRLAHLEGTGILIKKRHTTDKRKEVYFLTEKGLDLIPILLDLATWGAKHDPQPGAPQAWLAMVAADRDNIIQQVRETVLSGGSIFAGEDSLFSKLLAA